MIKKFNSWVLQNKLNVKESKYNTFFSIEGFGSFVILDYKETIIDKDFNIIISESDKRALETFNPNFVVFLFGGQFYFTPVNTELLDKEGKLYIPAELKDLKYLGKVKKDNKEFVNIGIHSEYELLNGSHSAKDWCQKAIFLNHKSLGIVDKNTLAGTLPFQISCKEKGIKSILGETITIFYDKTTENEKYDVKLYVKNETGWQNLLKINKYINIDNDGFITEEQFLENTKGLILVLFRESYLKRSYIKLLKEYFKTVYFQIDSVKFEGLDNEKANLLSTKQYLDNFSDLIEPVLINDSFYLEPEDYKTKITLNKIAGVSKPYSKDQYYKDVDESLKILEKYFPEGKVYKNGLNGKEILELAINNTNKIAEVCNFQIELGVPKLPEFPFEGDKIELFDYLLQEGWKNKIKNKVAKEKYLEYKKRMEYERDFVIKFNFLDFFLINWDIVNFAKSNGIRVGTARGSVAGSLLAFLLDITAIDPIKYSLLFERFLNETRFEKDKRMLIELDNGNKFDIPEKEFNNFKEGDTITKKILNNLSQFQV